MGYRRWMELDGTLETLEEVNRTFLAATGLDEPWCDEDAPPIIE